MSNPFLHYQTTKPLHALARGNEAQLIAAIADSMRPHVAFLPDLDHCILGIAVDGEGSLRAAYCTVAIVQTLMEREGLSHPEAVEVLTQDIMPASAVDEGAPGTLHGPIFITRPPELPLSQLTVASAPGVPKNPSSN